jgi:uncharacterized membrane protein YeaQ/YmgE (transglycosylase-associated protein family)
MFYMLALSTVIGDGVTIRIGNNVWTFGWNLIVYLLVAALVGLVAETLVGWRLPLGIIGAVIASLVGIWLMTQIVIISGVPEYYIQGVPLIRALVGAIIFVALWHLLTYGLWRSRGRYNRA